MTPSDTASRVHDAQVARELHEFALQLGRSASVELSSRLDEMTPKPGKPIGETIGELFPGILEKHFMRGVIGTREAAVNRARLVHALSALTLQGFEEGDRRPEADIDSASDRADAASSSATDEVMTSAEAARLLNVSRTYFNTLVETGKLGAIERTEGGHRRILKSVVLGYQAEGRRKQAQSLAEMAAASEALGLYDDEMEGIPRRESR